MMMMMTRDESHQVGGTGCPISRRDGISVFQGISRFHLALPWDLPSSLCSNPFISIGLSSPIERWFEKQRQIDAGKASRILQLLQSGDGCSSRHTHSHSTLLLKNKSARHLHLLENCDGRSRVRFYGHVREVQY